MPAVGVPGTHGRADARAFVKTDAGAVTITYTGTDARTDDGDARAVSRTVRGTHTCAVAETDDSSPFGQAHPGALLLVIVLERQAYGCYRLR